MLSEWLAECWPAPDNAGYEVSGGIQEVCFKVAGSCTRQSLHANIIARTDASCRLVLHGLVGLVWWLSRYLLLIYTV